MSKPKMDDDAMAALEKLPPQERGAKRREMCLQILSNRFGLKVHHETRRVPVYNLVIAKGGPKLTKADA